jgi:hypothetical protein
MIHLSDSAKRALAFIAVLVLVAMSGAAIYAILFQPAPPEAADAWGVRGGQVFPQEANFRGPVNVHNASDLTLYNASATPVVVIGGAAGDVDLAGTLTVPSLVTTTTDLTLTGDLAVGDDATITGDLLANTATITGAISAADLTASDDLVVGDDATITGTLALGDISIGGGYGTTGCTVSAAGVLQCDGAATVASATMAGALSAGSAAIGGGYGSTGCSFSAAGALQCDGDGAIDGALTSDSATVTGTVSAADLSASDDLFVTNDATITGTLAALGGISLENAETIGNAVNGTIAMTGAVDVSGALQYGANNLYPLGFGTDGYQMVLGSVEVTETVTVTHGLTTPLYGFCTMSGSLTDNEEQVCSLGILTDTVTIYVYKEDGSAGDSGVDVFWQVYGTP